MKKNVFLTLALSFVLSAFLTPATSVAQKISEGKIVFGINYKNLPPELEQMSGMLPKEAVTFFNKDFVRTESTFMMGSQASIEDVKRKKTTILIDMMGNKIATEMDTDAAQKEAEKADYKIRKTNETKNIAGYNCKKAVIEMKDETGAPQSFDVYYTDELSSSLNKKGVYDDIDGFMMAFSFSQQGMTIEMAVKEIKQEKVPADKFEIPEGYEMKTADELKGMLGG